MTTDPIVTCPCGAPMTQIGGDNVFDCTACDFTWSPRHGVTIHEGYAAFVQWQDFNNKAKDDHSSCEES